VLETVVGETFGYLPTATWTVLIISALGRRLAGRWFSFPGYVAAALIAVRVLVPLDVPGTDFASFLGYLGRSGCSPSPPSYGGGLDRVEDHVARQSSG
jgi:hypothetical protein